MNDHGNVLLYASAGQTAVEVRLERDTVWLAQAGMALLFATERSVITKHLRNIIRSGELEEKSNVQKMHIPSSDKPVAFYNLDMIISVGYRVNSKRGVQFRQWATRILREHLVRGYTVNQKRLDELKQAIRLVETVLDRRAVSGDGRRKPPRRAPGHARHSLPPVGCGDRSMSLLYAHSLPGKPQTDWQP